MCSVKLVSIWVNEFMNCVTNRSTWVSRQLMGVGTTNWIIIISHPLLLCHILESSLIEPAFDWVCLWPPQPGHCLHLLDKTQSPSPPSCQNNQHQVWVFCYSPDLVKLVHPRHRLTGHSLKELTAMRCSCSVIKMFIAWTQFSCSTSAPQCCPQCLQGRGVHHPSCKMQLLTVPNRQQRCFCLSLTLGLFHICLGTNA